MQRVIFVFLPTVGLHNPLLTHPVVDRRFWHEFLYFKAGSKGLLSGVHVNFFYLCRSIQNQRPLHEPSFCRTNTPRSFENSVLVPPLPPQTRPAPTLPPCPLPRSASPVPGAGWGQRSSAPFVWWHSFVWFQVLNILRLSCFSNPSILHAGLSNARFV